MVETLGEDGHRYAGHKGYSWTPAGSGRQFLDDGTVWVAHHPNSGWTGAGPFRRVAHRDGAGTLVPEPVLGTATFADNLNPSRRDAAPYTLHTATDALGTYGYWPATATVDADPDKPAVRNLTDTAPGRVYAGRPPTGDYVPATTTGLAYTSPGYRH